MKVFKKTRNQTKKYSDMLQVVSKTMLLLHQN